MLPSVSDEGCAGKSRCSPRLLVSYPAPDSSGARLSFQFRLFLCEDYDTVPVVGAVRLNIAAVILNCDAAAVDAVSVDESVSNSVGTAL